MQGRRVPDNEFLARYSRGEIEPGDYGRMHTTLGVPSRDAWWFCAPNGAMGRLSSAADPDSKGKHHRVVEHEDGHISVMPPENSILISGVAIPEWHGYINHGVWESA